MASLSRPDATLCHAGFPHQPPGVPEPVPDAFSRFRRLAGRGFPAPLHPPGSLSPRNERRERWAAFVSHGPEVVKYRADRLRRSPNLLG